MPEIFYTQVIEEWRATYAGPGNGDFVRSMSIDVYGNVHLTGNSRNTINSSDYATVMYSTSGVQQWAARYGGLQNFGAYPGSIAADKYGNTYVTGYAPLIGGNGASKFTTIKYNQIGKQCWVQIFYGQFYSNVEKAYCISIDTSVNIYITGGSYFAGTGCDYTTLKYDSSGTLLWTARYVNQGFDESYKVAVDNSGNVYVTGYSWGDTTKNDIATVKYNSMGIQQWVSRYNGPENRGDSAIDMKVDNSGNVYVTGASWGITNYDYVTIKYNSAGVQQWAARYNGGGNWIDYPSSLSVDDSGNVYVTGYSATGLNQLDCATIKYDSAGIQQWVVFYDNGGGDWGVELTLDKQSNIYVAAASAEGIRIHFATIKYSPTGAQLWVIRTYSLNGESPSAIAVDSLGNVYVSGSDGRYLTIKYNQVTGIKSLSSEIPDDFRLYQNYPNPFNPITKINFDISIMSRVELKVYDVIGKLVSTVYSGVLERGKYTLDFNASNIASGIYYYELMAESETGLFRDVKKMVVVK